MPLAIAYVLAGIGYGWVFEVLLRARPRGLLPIGAAVTIALLGAIGLARGSLVWPKNVRFVERHGTVTANLDTAITRAGGERRLEACGSVSASFLLTPPVAWTLDRHLAQVAPVSRVPGVTLRARLIEGLPLEPPRAAVANASGRRTLARTKYWDVEAACNESASTQGP